MTMQPRRRLLLAVAGVVACAFAPVPPPRTGVAEAVVNAFGGGAGGVRRTLLDALPRALQSEKVRALACLKGEKSPRDWLGKRLRAEEVAPGGPVRVRVSDCRPNEALALLSALVEAYETNRRVSRVYEVELLAAVRLQAQAAQGGGFPLVLIDEVTRRPDGPAVLQRPKLVSGTAR
jgi:hypothetical protein